MNAFKQTCIELRKRDHTLSEIMEVTGRSKTSVYFHIRNIPLSDKKRREIGDKTRVRAREVAAKRKGKAMRPFRTFTEWTPELVLLTAHLLFDGEMSKSCVYNNRSTTLVRSVQKHMRILYDYKPVTYLNRMTGVRRISYHNVALASFLRQKAAELVVKIHTFPLEHQRAFLRAFFDDEGCMDYREKRNLRRIRGYQDNRAVLLSAQRSLAQFGISSELKGKNEVVITGRENLRKFQKEINFSRGVRINGNRRNSIWRESIEKRVLLTRAIKSFKV